MIVVADTSAINYLVLIGEGPLLTQLYGEVILPAAVQRELLAERSPASVRLWTASPPSWIRFASPDAGAMIRTAAALDDGEREAIALALDLHADLLLIDDRQGRREAERLNLQYTGTLGVLLAAARRDLVDLDEAIRRLRRTSFFLSDQVLRRALREGR